MMKDLDYYLALPYTKVLRRDSDGQYFAHIEELPGCVADAETEEDAIKAVDEVKRGWIEEALSAKKPIPEPVAEDMLPSGKWLQRVPRSLHLRLTRLAKIEGVSLNHLVATILAEASASRTVKVQTATSSWTGFVGHLEQQSEWHDDAAPMLPQEVIQDAWAGSQDTVMRVLHAMTAGLPNFTRGRDRSLEDVSHVHEAGRKK